MLVDQCDNFTAFFYAYWARRPTDRGRLQQFHFFLAEEAGKEFSARFPGHTGIGPAAIFLRPKTSTVCSKVSVFYQHRACFAKYDGFAVTTSEGEGRKQPPPTSPSAPRSLNPIFGAASKQNILPDSTAEQRKAKGIDTSPNSIDSPLCPPASATWGRPFAPLPLSLLPRFPFSSAGSPSPLSPFLRFSSQHI